MDVKITDYGQGEVNFVEYSVYGLTPEQLNFLNENLEEKTEILGEVLLIRMYFDDRIYPFQSEVAKVRFDDFKAREEIEMFVFLSSFLEDL